MPDIHYVFGEKNYTKMLFGFKTLTDKDDEYVPYSGAENPSFIVKLQTNNSPEKSSGILNFSKTSP